MVGLRHGDVGRRGGESLDGNGAEKADQKQQKVESHRQKNQSARGTERLTVPCESLPTG